MALELDGEEATTPPRPPPPPVRPPPPPSNEQDAMRAWLRVQTDANAPDGAGPCQRSLHVAAVWRDRMLCFGGYDGSLISASRRVEAPSRHRRDSCPSDEVVGGFSFEFEAVRTVTRCRAQARGP